MKFLGYVSPYEKEFGLNVACDYRERVNKESIIHGLNSIRERCLDGKPIRWPYFEYMK